MQTRQGSSQEGSTNMRRQVKRTISVVYLLHRGLLRVQACCDERRIIYIREKITCNLGKTCISRRNYPSRILICVCTSSIAFEPRRKVKKTLDETIKITTYYGFVHYTGKLPRTQRLNNTSRSNQDASQPFGKSKKSNNNKKNGQSSLSSGNDDWKKNATCHICKLKEHISPNCPQKKESNNYIIGAFYAVLEVQVLAYWKPEKKTYRYSAIVLDLVVKVLCSTLKLAQMILHLSSRTKIVILSFLRRKLEGIDLYSMYFIVHNRLGFFYYNGRVQTL
ncbi:hypothetical protein PsorP6_004543 [Peronosclerospora sorghi]|uniref:Uncharacterized protein n=1 Tax=Peronosclerospora sorghi TaxID=230839 RepID=A0ACC0VQ17_9STRA|nr:hypothetical protein PsorP6_004543 [Peronosclerospora sorghi]